MTTHRTSSPVRALAAALALLLPLAACDQGATKAAGTPSTGSRSVGSTTEGGAGAKAAEDGAAKGEAATTDPASAGHSSPTSPRTLEGFDLSGLNPPGRAVREVPVPTTPTVTSKLVVVGEDTAKFGRVFEGDAGEHVFDVVVEGDEPVVVFDHQKTCGCTLGEFELVAKDGSSSEYKEGTPIEPGAILRVHGSLATEGKVGPQRHSITLRHNGANRTTAMNFECDVVPIFKIDPSPYLNFKEMFVNETRTASVTITSEVIDPFLLELDESFGLPDYLKVSVVPVDPDEDGRSLTWTVEGTIGPNAPEHLAGQQGMTVVLKTDVPLPAAAPLPDGTPRVRQINLHAIARVKPIVSAKPAFISFGAVRPGSSAERACAIEIGDDFVVDRSRLEQLEVVATDPKDQEFYDSIFTHSIQDGENGLIEVHLAFENWPQDHVGPFRGEIHIPIGHPLKSVLTVMFSGVANNTQPLPLPRKDG